MANPVDIDDLLESVVTLPSLPSAVVNVTDLLNDPGASLSAIGRAIAADPALALKTLRLVNSAYYGVREKVTSVEQAAVLLGSKVIRNLVFTAAVFDAIESSDTNFVRHCVSCGTVMRLLAKSGAATGVAFQQPEESFVFGLLHDVGKIVLYEYMHKEYEQVARLSFDRQIPWYEAEMEVIGITHAAVGARLAQSWKLPNDLMGAIAGHHDLSQCTNDEHKPKAALLAAADYICHAAGLAGPTEVRPRPTEEMWKLTGLTGESIVPVLKSVFAELDNIESLVELAA